MNKFFDDDFTEEKIKLIEILKNKNRMEIDEILGEFENGEL